MNIDTRGISVFLTGIWERCGGKKKKKRGEMTDRLKMNPKASETPTRVGKSRVSLLLSSRVKKLTRYVAGDAVLLFCGQQV